MPALDVSEIAKLLVEFGQRNALRGGNPIAELEEAARKDRIKGVKGLGAALQNKILQGLEIRRSGQHQYHLHRAAELLRAAEKNLRASVPSAKRIMPAGDFRRGCDVGFRSLARC
jgi:DNA polymerase (family 10)